jgi:hypothetical protein
VETGRHAGHTHAAGSRLLEARRAGRWLRNCEEKVQLTRVSRMPEGKRAGDLAQDWRASGLSLVRSRSRKRETWRSCLTFRKSPSGFDADRVGRRPQRPQLLDWVLRVTSRNAVRDLRGAKAELCKQGSAWRDYREPSTRLIHLWTAPGSERTGGTVGSRSAAQVGRSDRGSLQT